MDVELVTRTSLSSLQKIDAGLIVSPENLEDWTWRNLRKQFHDRGLEKFYSVYQRRLQNGYLSLFIILQLALGVFHCGMLIVNVRLQSSWMDVIVNAVVNALLFPIIAFIFQLKIIGKKPYLPAVFSCAIIVLMIVSDTLTPVYYSWSHYSYHKTGNVTHQYTEQLRPVYPTYTLLVIYVFLPLNNNLHAFTLGVTASLSYLAVLLFVTYRNSNEVLNKIIAEVLYFGSVNTLGLYFRFMNEVMIRRSFLDRRKCVESTLRLNYEKDQEEQLTRSILPPHFAAKIKKEFRDIFKFIEVNKKPPPQGHHERDLFVEQHDNVSILYADVVNFSGLTVTLPVKKLVETLNDLFGSFDEASERHHVLRIKFLGDCYYCVSGVPVPNIHHAKSCVDLGLDMIEIINEIRSRVQAECGVDVNMRIGVHSGQIISGILGSKKWQYDVWSRDVLIANKMEQNGEAGMVHVTQQTLELLENIQDYDIRPKTVKDEFLTNLGITDTFLIAPKSVVKKPQPTPTVAQRTSDCSSTTASELNNGRSNSILSKTSNATQQSKHVRFCSMSNDSLEMGRRRQTSLTEDQAEVIANTYRRRTHFMDTYIRDYHLMLKAADVEMEKAIETMPLTKWEQWSKWGQINPLLLTFTHWSWEIPYLKEPDPLFKFYILCAMFVLLMVGLILIFPSITKDSQRMLSDLTTVISYVGAVGVLVVLIPLTWTQFLWNRFKDPYDEYDGNAPLPRKRILNFLYQASVKVAWSVVLRTGLYCGISMMIATFGVFNLLKKCESKSVSSFTNASNDLTAPETRYESCVYTSWQFTETTSLAIITSFFFLRIHFVLKCIFGFYIASFYSLSVYYNKDLALYTYSETWHPLLPPKLAHIFTVGYLTFTLHLIDRQVEYLSRLDYIWKRQLSKEQDEAFHTRNANKLLLRNILPDHVADFYLNMNRTEENELYHEFHSCVAVMFASLTGMTLDEGDTLADFNEIICHFDRLLFEPGFAGRIEKIKLAGATYMAACGLDVPRRNSHDSNHSDVVQHCLKYNVTFVMARFAAQMMATLQKTQSNWQSDKNYRLRIGICHGEVTAGVVGSLKPLYDIWGDAVNMASRMDTTGVPGKIQITKDTAQVLMGEGVQCQLRGETYVKPKGFVTTYFVSLTDDKDLELIEETNL